MNGSRWLVRAFVIAFLPDYANAQQQAPQGQEQSLHLTSRPINATGGGIGASRNITALEVQGTGIDPMGSAFGAFHWVNMWVEGGQMRRSEADRSRKAVDFTSDSEAADARSIDGKAGLVADLTPAERCDSCVRQRIDPPITYLLPRYVTANRGFQFTAESFQ